MKYLSRIAVLGCLLAVVTLQSCTNNKEGKNARPIILGDSSSIVTETDSTYLTDLVLDLDFGPMPDIEDLQDSSKQNNQRANVPLSKEMMLSGGGLKAPFPEVTMFIPGITTRTFQDIDYKKANGASFQLTSGELNDNYLILQGATELDVAMRYQTVIVVRTDLGMLELSTMKTLTEWTSVSGKNGMYKIEGLTPNKLQHDRGGNAAIIDAVNRATKRKRMSRATRVAWESSVKDANSTSQRPLYVELTTVMWRVRGKDKDGSNFQKQLRIDIPISITVDQ